MPAAVRWVALSAPVHTSPDKILKSPIIWPDNYKALSMPHIHATIKKKNRSDITPDPGGHRPQRRHGQVQNRIRRRQVRWGKIEHSAEAEQPRHMHQHWHYKPATSNQHNQ